MRMSDLSRGMVLGYRCGTYGNWHKVIVVDPAAHEQRRVKWGSPPVVEPHTSKANKTRFLGARYYPTTDSWYPEAISARDCVPWSVVEAEEARRAKAEAERAAHTARAEELIALIRPYFPEGVFIYQRSQTGSSLVIRLLEEDVLAFLEIQEARG